MEQVAQLAASMPNVTALQAAVAPFAPEAVAQWQAFDSHIGALYGDIDVLTDWMQEHTEIPVFAVSLYIAVVFMGMDYMKDRKAWNLRPVVIAWNLILAVFSIVGTLYTFPAMVNALGTDGFRFTVCRQPREWASVRILGFWFSLFILSKIPEFFDTVLLVLQKKPVIFLHWYHHVTVMLYCWHAFSGHTPCGTWMAVMNYFVHAIMYSYYFMMSLSSFTRKMVKPFAIFITLLQIAQMVMGTFVTVYSFFERNDTDCIVPAANNKLGLAMYASYFVLFGKLFVDSYIKGGRKDKEKKRKAE